MSVVVAGYPRRDARRAEASGNGSRTRVVDVLYLSGIQQSAKLSRCYVLHLRTMPACVSGYACIRGYMSERNRQSGKSFMVGSRRIKFPIPPRSISSMTLLRRNLAITVWSDTALDTMRAGVPLIWLVPERLSAADGV